jgi:hypothetical protein
VWNVELGGTGRQAGPSWGGSDRAFFLAFFLFCACWGQIDQQYPWMFMIQCSESESVIIVQSECSNKNKNKRGSTLPVCHMCLFVCYIAACVF